ncbi:MAG: hypothetical protein WC220_14015 [Pedobacter sp.]|jgi:hypothetical protein
MHRTLDELLSKVADPADNEPEIESERAKNRVVLDGTSYTITIRTAYKEKSFQVSSPTTVSHPFIYQVIHQPLNFMKF